MVVMKQLPVRSNEHLLACWLYQVSPGHASALLFFVVFADQHYALWHEKLGSFVTYRSKAIVEFVAGLHTDVRCTTTWS